MGIVGAQNVFINCRRNFKYLTCDIIKAAIFLPAVIIPSIIVTSKLMTGQTWMLHGSIMIRIGFVPISGPAGHDTGSAGEGLEVVRARAYRDVAGVTTVVALRRWDWSGDAAWASENHS